MEGQDVRNRKMICGRGAAQREQVIRLVADPMNIEPDEAMKVVAGRLGRLLTVSNVSVTEARQFRRAA